LLASHRPARSYPNANLPQNAPEGCPNPLLNYYPYDIDLNTITLNKLKPQYFAVAGMDTYIYLHDRRMIGSGGGGAGRNPTFAKMSRCIRKFSTDRNTGPKRSKHVTACKFSDSNGQEVCVSIDKVESLCRDLTSREKVDWQLVVRRCILVQHERLSHSPK
jgi:hypothetical protein